MAIFKIDCDGVLRDILSKMCDIYNKEFNVKIEVKDCVKYNVDEIFVLCKIRLGISAKEYFFNIKGHEIFTKSKICKKAKDAIDILHNAGHKIIIVTWQRTLKNKIDTLNWLNHNNIYYDDIVFTKHKDIVKGDYMIDDNIDFLNEITNPTIPICINAPYNKNVYFYPRYESLYDFVMDILKDK